MQHRPILRAGAAAVFALAGVQAAHATSYHLVDLGLNKMPTQIDNRGDIAGYVNQGKGQAVTGAPLKYHGGKWARLANPENVPQFNSWTSGIDEQGDVVGYSYFDLDGGGTLWPHGDAAPIHMAGGGALLEVRPAAIAAGEQVVGYGLTLEQNFHCALWTPTAGTVDLGLMANGQTCLAFGINASGQIVGQAATDGTKGVRAFLYEQGRFRGLSVLPGDQQSSADAINERGHVVGWSGSNDYTTQHAFLWSGGAMKSLVAGPDFAAYSWALAINSHDQIVGGGAATSASDPQQALEFTGGQAVALSTEVVDALDDWQLQAAVSINDSGLIVGQGQRADGMHGFMLVPVAQ